MSRRLGMVLAACGMVLGGCKSPPKVIAPQGKFLLIGYDVLTRPGQTVALRARLQKASLNAGCFASSV